MNGPRHKFLSRPARTSNEHVGRAGRDPRDDPIYFQHFRTPPHNRRFETEGILRRKGGCVSRRSQLAQQGEQFVNQQGLLRYSSAPPATERATVSTLASAVITTHLHSGSNVFSFSDRKSVV